MKRLFVVLCSLSLLAPGQSVLASHPTSILVESLDERTSFSLAGMNDISGASLALADLGDDGIPEIIVGNGMGSEPRVFVLRQDGGEVGSFLAYAPTLGVGINVTSCDLTGDGYSEIIVAPQRGGGPHIRIFNRYGTAIDGGGFFAYDEGMRMGVNLACGNLIGDERAELVTLPAPGGGPHVRVWSWDETEMLVENFFAFHRDDRSGIVGVVHDKKLFLAQQHTSTPTLKTIVIHTSPTTTSENKISLDGLGVQSLAMVNNELYLSTASSSTLYNLTQNSTTMLDLAHPSLAGFDDELIFTSGRLLFNDTTEEQRIEVDVSEQRLYAFEQGILRNSFLISSGLNNTTPIGTHSVLQKVPLVHYAWNYGEGNPNNYDLGWIPYNLRIYPHIYIHYAPWHNNFGHQMSHGCVNVNLTNIQWLYDWAQIEIPVEIKT
ncbi:MAG: L,D-transpeptidase [Candidatus Uhrbacteria bacterium]|nr:L,D-transpeptidase [Candidatus Uhrbacteria bacterium]